jgi:hypothetical protein
MINLGKYLSHDGNVISIPAEDVKLMNREELVKTVAESTISYPLLKYFYDKPYNLYRNLITYHPVYSGEDLNFVGIRWLDRDLKTNKYRDKSLALIQNDDDYEKIDRLTDLMTEYARIEAKRYDKDQSPLEYFNTHKAELINECIDKTGAIDSFEIREIIWRKKYEATNFKVTLATGIYIYFNARRILDISAGWGDRLIAAIGQHAERYLAYDPNKKLYPGHKQIMDTFSEYMKSGTTHFEIRYEPFESANLGSELFDLIFTSPPYFNLEIYDTTDTEGTQSISKYNLFEGWLTSFLFRSLLNAWNHLQVGGNMVIHITDFGGHSICEPMILFVLSKCRGARFSGVIGTVGESKRVMPMWAFYKDKLEDKHSVARADNSFKRNYREVYDLMIRNLRN